MLNTLKEPEFFSKLSLHARQILRASFRIARKNHSSTIEPIHLLFSVFKEKHALGKTLLEKLGIHDTPLDLSSTHTKPSSSTHNISSEPTLSKKSLDIIAEAFLLANRFAYPYVGSEHIVHALIESKDPDIITFLSIKNVAHPQKKNLSGTKKSQLNIPELAGFARIMKLPDIGFSTRREGNASETPHIDQYGVCLGENTPSSILSVNSRSNEIESVLRTLGRKTKSNPLLIGEPGVGKTTVVEAVARRIARGEAGPAFDRHRIVLLDLASLVAGTSFRGEFESRLKEVVREAREHPEIILFLDEIHTLVGTGNVSGGLDAANLLKPALARGDIRCIGATTLAEYKRHIEKDAALERRFHIVSITEPTQEETIHMLLESRAEYEKHHHIRITKDTIQSAVTLSVRHLPNRFLPDKAFDLLDEAASALRRKSWKTPRQDERSKLIIAYKTLVTLKRKMIEEHRFDEAEILHSEEHTIQKKLRSFANRSVKKNHEKVPILSTENIAETLAEFTGTPLEKIIETPGTTSNIFPLLSTTIIGQEDALHTLSKAIVRSQLGISNTEHRPFASFLFLGPSGVGKTLTATTLAETLFDGKHALLRIDMSEFAERHHIAQMIGSPAGYIGYGEGGTLTEHVRRHPSSVILFDEIEKAHPDVLNILLQILGEGILTDAEGKRAYFNQSIIVLTSNIGTNSFSSDGQTLGFGESVKRFAPETQQKKTIEATKQHFRPELLARIDHIITFRPLELESLCAIANQEITRLEGALTKKHIQLRVSPEIGKFIAEACLSDKDGARAVRRNIETLLGDPIADLLVTESISPKEISASLNTKKKSIAITSK